MIIIIIITLHLKLLCNCSDAYVLVKETIAVPNTAGDTAVNNTNKKENFVNCASFTSCITQVNNTQVDNAEDIDIIMLTCNLVEYSDACSKA